MAPSISTFLVSIFTLQFKEMKWFLIFVPRLLCLFLLGNQHGSALVDQLQEQENVLQECVRQMESAETTRAALVYQLKEALHDQVLFCFF